MQEKDAPGDPIIGLDVGGHRPLFYCHLSTLTNGSQYFASRFIQNHMQPGGYRGKDEFGAEVYFVDRNGALFHYVLEYLRNNAVDLPAFQEDPKLWRALRREAAFFCMNGLLSMLQVTYSCSPTPGPRGDRGILYWLGTNRGRGPYQNPYQCGAVNVGGWLDEEQYGDEHSVASNDSVYGLCTQREYSKTTFVQYRQKLDRDAYVAVGRAGLNWCDGNVGTATVLDLQDNHVRLTHYSLRYGDCSGMTSDWVFAGSNNGEHWNVLHEAKSESYIEAPEVLPAVRRELGISNADDEMTPAQRDAFTDWAEKHCRRTWEIPDPMSNAFYRFFRIQKVGFDDCLHGTSLEIFGDVNECPDE